MHNYKYLKGYSENIIQQVDKLVASNSLKSVIKSRYPQDHSIKSPNDLYKYAMDIKNKYMKKSSPISKVEFSETDEALKNALGVHKFIPRVQGSKIKSKNVITVSSVFKNCPTEFLRFIIVHELAHIKEKEHNKQFYALCEYMNPGYHQVEFDMRLFLTFLDISGENW